MMFFSVVFFFTLPINKEIGMLTLHKIYYTYLKRLGIHRAGNKILLQLTFMISDGHN